MSLRGCTKSLGVGIKKGIRKDKMVFYRCEDDLDMTKEMFSDSDFTSEG